MEMWHKHVAVLVLASILLALPVASAGTRSIELLRIMYYNGGKYSAYPIGSGGWVDNSWIYGVWLHGSDMWWGAVIQHYLIYGYNYKTNETRAYRFQLWDEDRGYYTRYDVVYQFPGTNILTFIDFDTHNNTIAVFKNNTLKPLFNIDLKEIADNMTRSFSERGASLRLEGSFYWGLADGNYTYLLISGEHVEAHWGLKAILVKVNSNSPINTPTSVSAVKLGVPIYILNEHTVYKVTTNNIAVSRDKLYIESVDNTILVSDKDTLLPLRYISYSYNDDMGRLACSIYPHNSGFYLLCYGYYSKPGRPPDEVDVYVTKFDANANPIWSRAYDAHNISESSYRMLHASLVEFNNTLYIGLLLRSTGQDSLPTVIAVDPRNGDIINYFSILAHPFMSNFVYVTTNPYVDNDTLVYMYTDNGWADDYELYSIVGAILIPSDAPRDYYIQPFYPVTIDAVNAGINVTELPLPAYETITINVYPPDNVTLEEISPQLLQFYIFTVKRISLFTWQTEEAQKPSDYTIPILLVFVLATTLAYITSRPKSRKSPANPIYYY